MLKREIIQSVKEKELRFQQKENLLSKQLIEDKEKIKLDNDNLIKDFELKYQLLLEEINKNKKIITDRLNQLNDQYHKTNYSEPLKDKIGEILKTSENYKQDINNKQYILQNLENKLELNKKDLKFKTEQYNAEITQIDEKQNSELKKLNNRLIELTQKLEVAENSLSGFLEKNYLGYQENIAKLVSEEILFSTELEPVIKEKSNLFFGISLNLTNLPKAKTLDDYKIEQGELQKYILDFNEQYKNNLEQIKDKYRIEIENFNKKISEHEKNQFKTKKELVDLRILLENETLKLSRIKAQSSEAKAKELEKIKSEILKERSELNQAESEENTLKSDLAKEINLLNQERQDKVTKLDNNYVLEINNLKNNLDEFKEINRKRITEINHDYHKELQDKGIDNTKISQLQKNQSVLNFRLKFIDENSQYYYKYLSDKADLLDKVDEFHEKIKHINLEKEANNKEFNKKKSIISQDIEKAQNNLKDNNKALLDLENELKIFHSFKESSLYTELSEYIINERYFIDSENNIIILTSELNNLKNQLLEKINTLREKVTRYTDNFDNDNIFAFNKNNYSDKDFMSFALNLGSFIEDERIKEYETQLSTTYSLILSSLSQQMNELTSKESEIQKTISRINSSFEKTRLIDVIKDIELKLKPSNNRIIHFLNKIREFNEQNPFAGEFNLFNQSPDKDNEDKAISLLKNLKQSIEESKSDKVSLEESFEIEFRIKENNNDTGFIERLTSIGSNGTDVLVKAMIYITLLDVAKSRLKIKDFKIHCIVDEVGILDNNYLKYLIQFANEKDILLINGSPNPAEAFLYNSIYRVKKDQKSNSIVRPLIEARINEITPEFSPDTATVN